MDRLFDESWASLGRDMMTTSWAGIPAECASTSGGQSGQRTISLRFAAYALAFLIPGDALFYKSQSVQPQRLHHPSFYDLTVMSMSS